MNPVPAATTARMENLSGRTDDMLKIRGVNVFPSQIEEVLINTEESGLTMKSWWTGRTTPTS